MRQRLPVWLRREIPHGSTCETHEAISELSLNTVCESALCPNRLECYSKRTATFMILGDLCTRRCGFCAIPAGRPREVEESEPSRVALAAKKLDLKHVVVTSVARDDLKDEGAEAFYQTILALREVLPDATIEVLTPDFHAKSDLIRRVCDAHPDVFNHNIETVRRLTPLVRPQARYERSLRVFELIKECDSEMTTKSGLMLGLGETLDEVREAFCDLKSAGCDMVTVGQYLKPAGSGADGGVGANSRKLLLEVEAFIRPEIFSFLEAEGKRLGFKEVYAGPYVRSSYHAGEAYQRSLNHSQEKVIQL